MTIKNTLKLAFGWPVLLGLILWGAVWCTLEPEEELMERIMDEIGDRKQ